eukprot:scaffold1784_cov364-Prasinococcus_capsulatus_cf.AAC.2
MRRKSELEPRPALTVLCDGNTGGASKRGGLAADLRLCATPSQDVIPVDHGSVGTRYLVYNGARHWVHGACATRPSAYP